MPAIYRTYRPQTFAEIVGQDHITSTLQQAILKNKVAHAFLFQGPRGTGKTTTARILAKRLQCASAAGAEPCGQCDLCQATAANRNIDIIEIDAASNRGIDDIRALREATALAPAMSKYKVYIIDEIHMLTGEAFAALLKTLEEPVQHVVFILATTELHKVPATILSRCQVYRFRRATGEEMRSRLTHILKGEKRSAGDDVLNFIISRSDGCYRDAESLLGQMLTAQEDPKLSLVAITESLGLPAPDTINKFLTALLGADTAAAVDIVATAYKEGVDPEQFINESIRVARDGALSLAKQENIPAFAQQTGAAAKLPIIMRALVQATQDLAYVPQPLIALQLAILTATAGAPAQSAAPASVPAAAQRSKAPATTIPAKPPRQPVTQATARLNHIISLWPQLIAKVKETNPVSATFLRATEPMALSGNNIILRVQFTLHQNFFTKPTNKTLIENVLTDLTGTPTTISCHLADQTAEGGEVKAKEERLLKNVKELFGIRS